MSKELTEKWKLGEEFNSICNIGNPSYYYIKDNGKTVIKEERVLFDMRLEDRINSNWEILSPVPSYDDMEIIDDVIVKCMKANQKLLEENERLKKQLEELKQ